MLAPRSLAFLKECSRLDLCRPTVHLSPWIMPTTHNGIGTRYFGKRNLESRRGTCPYCHREIVKEPDRAMRAGRQAAAAVFLLRKAARKSTAVVKAEQAKRAPGQAKPNPEGKPTRIVGGDGGLMPASFESCGSPKFGRAGSNCKE